LPAAVAGGKAETLDAAPAPLLPTVESNARLLQDWRRESTLSELGSAAPEVTMLLALTRLPLLVEITRFLANSKMHERKIS
jgi:hypothetical protein